MSLKDLKIGASLVIATHWLDKRVKNPKTGNMVKVRSLPPKMWDKYRPKDAPVVENLRPEHEALRDGIHDIIKPLAEDYGIKPRLSIKNRADGGGTIQLFKSGLRPDAKTLKIRKDASNKIEKHLKSMGFDIEKSENSTSGMSSSHTIWFKKPSK